MGQEVVCTARWGGKSVRGKALLETAEILFRGEERRKIPFSAISGVEAKDGDTLPWGGFHASVIHTPGHTPGSVSLYMPKDCGRVKLVQPQLFAGDTLFAGSIGRTDLWGGSMEQIMESLRGKLMQLPDDTLVHPGHGGSTTIGLEKEMNPFLK